jgi:hypothetical protein
MRRSLGALASVLAVLALTAGNVLAVGGLDQQQTNGSVTSLTWSLPAVAGSRMDLRQTLKVGKTGKLDTVAVDGDDLGHSVTLSIGDNGGILDKQTISMAGGWTQVSLATPPKVTSGETLIIELTPTQKINWYGTCDNLYSGGSAYVFDPVARTVESIPAYGVSTGSSLGYCTLDFAFKTYVTAAAGATPKPTPTPKAAATPAAAIATPTPSAGVAAQATPSIAAAVESASAGATSNVLGASSAASPGSDPAASTSGGSGGAGSSSLPIAVVGLLALIVAGGGLLFLLLKRRRTATP